MVGPCGVTVNGSGIVGGHVLCACVNECHINNVYSEANVRCAVVGNKEVEIVLTCRSLGDIHLNVLVAAAANLGVGNGSRCALGLYCVELGGLEGRSDSLDLRPVKASNLFVRLLGGIKGCALCAGSDPLVLGTLILGSAGVETHPAYCSLVTAPIVSEDSTGSLGNLLYDSNVACLLNGIVGGYHVYGLTVNEPSDRCLGPAVAVGVEVLGSVEAEVVHILIAALAVNEEVELYVGGVLTKELNVNLIMGIGLANALAVLVKKVITVLVKEILCIIVTGASEEGACSTGVSRGLHGYSIITVVVIILCTSLTCGVIELYLGVVKPSGSLLLGDAKSHDAVLINNVVLLPYNVKYVTIGPTVGLKEYVGICAVCKIDKLAYAKGSCLDINLGIDYSVNEINRTVDELAAAERHECHKQ